MLYLFIIFSSLYSNILYLFIIFNSLYSNILYLFIIFSILFRRFGKSVEFKKYLHGICDAGSRLLLKFRSGTHGLNEELSRHRGREGKTKRSLGGNECENVSHVLWECSAYSSTRASFMKKLQELLEDDYI